MRPLSEWAICAAESLFKFQIAPAKFAAIPCHFVLRALVADAFSHSNFQRVEHDAFSTKCV